MGHSTRIRQWLDVDERTEILAFMIALPYLMHHLLFSMNIPFAFKLFEIVTALTVIIAALSMYAVDRPAINKQSLAYAATYRTGMLLSITATFIVITAFLIT